MFDTREIQIETFHDKEDLKLFIYQNNLIILDIKYVVESGREHFLIIYKM